MMTTPKRNGVWIPLAALAFAISVGVGAQSPAAGQNRPGTAAAVGGLLGPQDVKIVNGPANAVPVIGTVTLGNTPAASIFQANGLIQLSNGESVRREVLPVPAVYLPLLRVGNTLVGSELTQTRLANPSILVRRDASAGLAAITYSISGYLVDEQ